MSVGTPSIFLLMATGQIESGEFPEFDELSCHYNYVYGKDWDISTGVENGISQISKKSQDDRQAIVWNFPIDVTFKSTNPFGWPQLVMFVCGRHGSDTSGSAVRGYGAVHIPFTPGRHRCRVAMFVPESTSTFLRLLRWAVGRQPEFVDNNIVAHSEGREVTRVRTQGYVTVSFNVTLKNTSKLGYEFSTSESQHINSHGFASS